MPSMAINHMTMPKASTVAMLDMAQVLGCVGVELRNDLTRGLFDDQQPEIVRAAAHARDLRILALAEVYAFNDNSESTRNQVRELLALALASGAEAIVLIPRIADAQIARADQRALLRAALKDLLPILERSGVVALIEPLGFANSSLRLKEDAVAVLAEMGHPDCFALVHDTFHHTLAGEAQVFADATRIVHVSGVTNPTMSFADMQDSDRVLVDADDRLGNIAQIKQLQEQGYTGPLSFEAFAPDIQNLDDPTDALLASRTFIASRLDRDGVK